LLFNALILGGELKRSPQLDVESSLIRNIGIIAHIDAGKTTVTERLLYLAGATSTMGDVDSGNTVTDFMELERERGITIQSAAISLFWRQHKINLIDTPGHVDFTLEVERCARVLDGAVTVLDGSAGVQAQTMTVWRQANKFNLPSVFFVNKMDKRGADFKKSIDSIKTRLGMEGAIAVSVPSFAEDGRFIGVIDLISQKYIDVEQGDDANWTTITESSHRFEELMAAREEMLSSIADADEKFAEHLLSDSKKQNGSDFDTAVSNAIRRATLARTVVPVACGTALRCAGSVEPLLNMVINYLPAPDERNHMVSKVFGQDLSAIVFKVGHEKRRGQLSFIRVYTGEIANGASVYNANRGTLESRISTFIPKSDILQPVDVIRAGNIGVLTGLQSTVTGDTLLASENAAKNASAKRHEIVKNQKDKKLDTHHMHAHDLFSLQIDDEYDPSEVGKSVLLAGIETPDPVYFCSAEPPSAGALHSFEKALKELAVEDPSLRVSTDGELGQTVIEGMGELHIEVVKDRLKRDYGLNVFMGPLQVAYREVISDTATHTASVEDVLGDRKHGCTLTLEVAPSRSTKFKSVAVKLDEHSAVPYIRAEWLKAINEGCASALHNGPILGYPMDGVAVTVLSLVASGGKLNPAIICACAGKCLGGALKKANAHLIEPIMRVEVTLVDMAAKTGVNAVLREIGKRRGTILNVEGDGEGASMVRVSARLPLAELFGISGTIRTITSGLGDMHMQLEGYDSVSTQAQAFIKSKTTSRKQ
uniref:Tr-type G domain-containing protein n=1 Tax=Toxocara canis TaxID=6265 RepID=A0A183UTS0_TOXCA